MAHLGESLGKCRLCGRTVAVRYLADGGRVYLQRHCPEHGAARALVAESLSWYQEAMDAPRAERPPRRVLASANGCPDSCGPCALHAQRCQLPVFSITNACELRCPICFTFNREDRIYYMAPEEFRREIDFVIGATGGVDLINITGGEPTLHPKLLELLETARRPEIGRITINSNGLSLARDPELAARLAELGVYVILSVDTFDPEISVKLHGRDLTRQKREALRNLERFGVQTTLLMVLVGGINEGEVGQLLDWTLRRDFVRSLTIQTMTYSGQGGGSFLPRVHIPVDGVERRIEEASAGRIRRKDFVPLPTAHPLCYGVAYLLADEAGGVHSFSEVLGRETLIEYLADGYLLHPSDRLEVEIRRAIDRLWSEGKRPALLRALKGLLQKLYPPGAALTVHERQRRAERMVKTIYVHAHMDEDTYEVGRAVRCPDQVSVRAERLIPACNYNLFCRARDEIFWRADEHLDQAT